MMVNLEFLIVLIWCVIIWNLFTIATIVMAKDLFRNKIEDEEEEKEEKEEEEDDSIVEFVWEDEDWNWLYRIR